MLSRHIITAAVLIGSTLLLPLAAFAGGYIYMYRQPNGGFLFTDQKVEKHDYQLVRRMGRPTATTSCIGVNRTMLDRRAHHYQASIERLASAYRLDPLLIRSIITVESCFDPHATSTVGAKGLMQVMPSTGAELGFKHLYVPSDNLNAGMSYFRSLLEQFSNNVELALAAYNAGPKAVIKYGGVPPYTETKCYVTRVMRHYRALLKSTMDDHTGD